MTLNDYVIYADDIKDARNLFNSSLEKVQKIGRYIVLRYKIGLLVDDVMMEILNDIISQAFWNE